MFDTIEISNEEIACDGGGSLGHPKVYLHIDHDNGEMVTCPYCSRTYVLRHARLGNIA